jgi:hypothetical protein
MAYYAAEHGGVAENMEDLSLVVVACCWLGSPQLVVRPFADAVIAVSEWLTLSWMWLHSPRARFLTILTCHVLIISQSCFPEVCRKYLERQNLGLMLKNGVCEVKVNEPLQG